MIKNLTWILLFSHLVLKHIPTIIVTENEKEKIRALVIGGDDFISKPYYVEEINLLGSRADHCTAAS